jgi:proteic killer suppression protein
MQLVGFRHKGLRQLYEDGKAKGVPPPMVDKLRKLLLAIEPQNRIPGWRLHALKGGLKGFWSLTLTGNWRLIFLYDKEAATAGDIDLVDYH